MICPNCNTVNDSENVFCVNCGAGVSSEMNIANPLNTPNKPGFNPTPTSQSTETAVVPMGQGYAPAPSFNPTPGYSAEYPAQSKNKKTIWFVLGALGVVVIAAVSYLLINKNSISEALPEHLGLFVQNNERNHIDEVRKEDVSNAIQAKNDLLKSDTMPTLDASPNLILYSDGKDIPINDLRLVPLDTIKDDGSMKQLDFQAAPVEGKPEMKRIRVPDALANGKYAFVLLDGFLNEGKHKFWTFQIRNSSRSDNGDALKSSSVALKPTPPPQPSAPKMAPPASAINVAPPSPGNNAVSITDSLILRAGPSQSYPKIRNLARGESVTILSYSTNTESFKGRSSPFAQVRTANGQIGWAFSAFLR